MNFINLEFLLLLFSALSILFLLIYTRKNNKTNQMNRLFSYVLFCILIISFGVISQAIGNYIYNINPIYFEYIIYVGTCFLPVALYFTSLTFSSTKVQYSNKHILFFIVPIISLVLLWTNNYHNLFYIKYSSNINETLYGNYFYIHTIYTYLMFFLF